MPLDFDATLKDIAQELPHDWLAALGIATTGPVAVRTPDLSTLTRRYSRAVTAVLILIGTMYN